MPLPMARAASPPDPRLYQIHAVFPPVGPVDGFGLSEIPKHCRFRAGDWVVLHGYPGTRYSYSSQRHGWRGFVLGYMGGTWLRGLTDDGREWCEHWGFLDREGQRGDPSSVLCTCCPHPQAHGPRPATLFDL